MSPSVSLLRSLTRRLPIHRSCSGSETSTRPLRRRPWTATQVARLAGGRRLSADAKAGRSTRGTESARCPTRTRTLADCIASQNGQFSVQNAYRDRFTPDGCALQTRTTGIGTGTRCRRSPTRAGRNCSSSTARGFTVPGKKYYPVRRFVNVYVTAADGFSCPGDNSAGEPVRAQHALGPRYDVFAGRTPAPHPAVSSARSRTEGVCVPGAREVATSSECAICRSQPNDQ